MSVTSTPLAERLRMRDVTGAAPTRPCGRTTLADVPDGAVVTVLGVCDDAHPAVARRLFDLGFTPGTEVTRLRHAPLGDPVVVRVADVELALRRAQAGSITVADGHDARACTACGR